MELPKIDYFKSEYPLKTLLMGNEDTWGSLVGVVEDLTDDQLQFKSKENPGRSIAEIIQHIPDTQYLFYTRSLVMEEKYAGPMFPKAPKTTKEAFDLLSDAYQKIVGVWQKITPKQLKREFETEWGQKLNGELALFQSITHTHYHVSEICFLRGCGGFPTKAMG